MPFEVNLWQAPEYLERPASPLRQQHLVAGVEGRLQATRRYPQYRRRSARGRGGRHHLLAGLPPAPQLSPKIEWGAATRPPRYEDRDHVLKLLGFLLLLGLVASAILYSLLYLPFGPHTETFVDIAPGTSAVAIGDQLPARRHHPQPLRLRPHPRLEGRHPQGRRVPLRPPRPAARGLPPSAPRRCLHARPHHPRRLQSLRHRAGGRDRRSRLQTGLPPRRPATHRTHRQLQPSRHLARRLSLPRHLPLLPSRHAGTNARHHGPSLPASERAARARQGTSRYRHGYRRCPHRHPRLPGRKRGQSRLRTSAGRGGLPQSPRPAHAAGHRPHRHLRPRCWKTATVAPSTPPTSSRPPTTTPTSTPAYRQAPSAAPASPRCVPPWHPRRPTTSTSSPTPTVTAASPPASRSTRCRSSSIAKPNTPPAAANPTEQPRRRKILRTASPAVFV